jgi:hypothetical protein
MQAYLTAIVFTLLISNTSVRGQEKVFDSAFDQVQSAALNKWINLTGLGSIIHFSGVKIYDDSISQFIFSVPGTKAWSSLNDSLRVYNLPSAEQFIGDKVTFLFDRNPQHTQLIFEGADGSIIVTSKGSLFESFTEYFQGNMDPDRTKIAFTSRLSSRYTNFFDINVNKTYDLKQYKQALVQIVKEMCKGHSTAFNDYRIDTDLDIEGDFRITITNIKKLVLDQSYFEKILIRFFIDPAAKKIDCQYACKYSAGNLWAPNDSRYRDASEQSPEMVENFGNKLKSHIYNSL